MLGSERHHSITPISVGGSHEAHRHLLRRDLGQTGALGLAFDAVKVGDKNYLGETTDSYAIFLGGVYARKNPRHYRIIGATRFGNEVVDDSVQCRRREDRVYEPQYDGLPKLN